jgi:hypothetical protein
VRDERARDVLSGMFFFLFLFFLLTFIYTVLPQHLAKVLVGQVAVIEWTMIAVCHLRHQMKSFAHGHMVVTSHVVAMFVVLFIDTVVNIFI